MGLRSCWISAATGTKPSVAGYLLILCLLPFSWLYRMGLALYLWGEKCALRTRSKLPVRVVSIGNLTMGGTGKTGVVEALGRIVKDRARTAVLLRGYGGAKSREGMIVSNGVSVLADWKDSGDEAALLASVLPGVRVLVGRDRRVTGRWAVKDLDAQLIILDDGLQYWQLSRDIDIILLDARNPFGNGQVMPAGVLREPVSGLRRADVVILTHHQEASLTNRAALMRIVSRINPKASIHLADYTAVGLVTPTGNIEEAETLRGKYVMAFCAIGSPHGFTSTLEDAGAKTVVELFLPDHHPVSQDDVDLAEAWAKDSGAELVLSTEKDWVKIKDLRVPDCFRALKAEMMISDLDSLVSLVLGRSL